MGYKFLAFFVLFLNIFVGLFYSEKQLLNEILKFITRIVKHDISRSMRRFVYPVIEYNVQRFFEETSLYDERYGAILIAPYLGLALIELDQASLLCSMTELHRTIEFD